MRRILLGVVATLLSSIVNETVLAHDLMGVLHDLDSSKVPESVRSFNKAYISEGNQSTRAVLVNALKWPTPARLTVCFDKGPTELRQKIAAAMREWTDLTEGMLDFDFGDRTFRECDGVNRFNIRIGFVQGSGHWSQIGTVSDSELVFPENSMNLDFDVSPPLDDQAVRELTLHETGHALGFHHEHQSPGTPCKNWNWTKILKDYKWPGDTQEERDKAMHQNMDRLNDYVLTTGQHTYTYTAYDPRSIMHYSFPAEMFTDGSANVCAIAQVYNLSPMDMQAMKDAYPRQRKEDERARSIDGLLGDTRFQSFRELLEQQKGRSSR